MAAVYLPLLLSASALIISIVSFFYFNSYLKQRTGQERILAEFREEVNNIIKSIAETTDRDISLIEDREKKLKTLLEEVDKRLGLYIREMERYSKAEKTHAALSAVEEKPAATYTALGKKRYKRGGPEATAESKPEPAPPPPSVSDQIRSLMRSGLTDAAIASRLGISIAEVEFAAALFERRDGE
jgi:hypothetical protein